MALENKGAQFKIEWKIKNFEDFPREKGQLLSSPVFVIDTLQNSQWVLHLYPDGENDGNGMFTSLYLVRQLDDDCPLDIVLDCQLSFSTPGKKAPPLAWRTVDHVFRKGSRCGSQEFLNREKMWSYLEDNILTVNCLISQDDTDSSRSGGCVAVSMIGTEIRNFKWIIEDFDDLQSGDQRVVSVKSASKEAQSITMTLSVTSENELMVDISPVDGTKIKRAYCSLDTGKGEKCVHCGGGGIWFNKIKAGENWRICLSHSKDDLLKKLTGNSLHLDCFFIFFLGIELEKVESTYYQPLSCDSTPKDESCNIM